MTISLEIVIILVLILINGLFSLSEMALVSVRRARLAVLERKGVKGAAAARGLADDPQRFLPTVQIGITLVSVLTGVFGGARIASHLQAWLEQLNGVAPYAESLALAIVVVVTTYMTLVLGELVPKQIALRSPELMAARVARPIIGLAAVAGPLVWLLGKSSAAILRLFGLQRTPRQTVTEEELKALLFEGAQTGMLEMEERDMIERVLRLADKPVRAIMTPRTELAWIDRTHPAKSIAAALKAAPHSRFVVCDKSIDNVVGVVQAKDLLDRILGGGELSVGASLRQPMIVPDTITALDALERLKSDPLGLALVMDEYGSFEGVVTAADVLQAIVGDASGPEHQDGVPGPEGETTMTLDGMTPVDELKVRLNLPDLPAEGRRFEVTEMDGRRVDTVLAGREPAAEA
jgi:putative hemolysin